MNFPHLTLYLTGTLILLLTPGPAVLYIVARSLSQGRLAGLVSVLGLAVGTLFHVAAATLGLSALIVTSAVAFRTVKILGALYLIYLGVRTLASPGASGPGSGTGQNNRPPRRVFWDGLLVNLLNPKTAVFFLAFLPQFVDPASGKVAGQMFLLGILFVVLGLATDSLYALLAGGVGRWLEARADLRYRTRLLSGAIYLVLGIAAGIGGAEVQ